jgi:hypothetical protein
MTVSSIGSVTNPYQTPSTDGFIHLFNDFKGIGGAIQSGDLTTAQSALTTFQNDLQSNTGKNPLSQLFSNNSTLGNDLTALQSALKSNDPTAAQNAFKTLIQDMQSAMKTQRAHRHHHHRAEAENDGDADDGGQNSTSTATTSAATTQTVGGTIDTQA